MRQKRIEEDYLRILRFLRFSIQYKDFDEDDQTFRIIQKNLNGIIKLSKERIFSELIKIINLENIKDIFSKKEFYEIFKVIFPELKYSEKLKGMKLSEAQSIFNDFTKLVKGDADTLEILNDEDSLYALKGVEAFPMRVKCATLSWHTLVSALEDKKEEVKCGIQIVIE